MFFNSKKKSEGIALDKESKVLYNKEEGIVKIERDGLQSSDDNLDFLKFASKQSGFKIFRGKVEHAYESDYLGYKDHCPRCNAPTLKMYSHFPYATNDAMRVMSGPAGHFCTKCPTVIIDDDMMRSGIFVRASEYLGVVGVETGENDDPGLFSTLNGEDSIYFLSDESKEIEGIHSSVHQPCYRNVFDFIDVDNNPSNREVARKNQIKSKKKNKSAREARKRNRRRK